MARSKLGMSDAEFWDCSPRRLLAMIKAWIRIEHPRAEEDEEQTGMSIVDTLPML